MNELEAINSMLSVIGEPPVNMPDENVDAVVARRILHETSRLVQTEGWYFNMEYNFPLTPDVDGFIYVPENMISVNITPLNTVGRVDVIIRGNRLYNLNNHTFVFEPLRYRATVIFIHPFAELPHTAKEYIRVRAGRKFQTDMVGSEALNQFTQMDEFTARGTLMREQVNSNAANFLGPVRNSPFGHSVPARAVRGRRA